MAILIDTTTRIAVQTAFDGDKPRAALQLPVYASNTVAHVTLRGADGVGTGHWFLDSLPIFTTIADAVSSAKANTALIYAEPALAADAVVEAVHAGLPLVVLIAEDVPAEGRAQIRQALADSDTVLVGPGVPELVTPDGCQIGATPSYIFIHGKIGILSESGALSREVALQTSALGLGQSSVISLDRAPLSERTFIDCFKRFLDDEDTEGVVLLTDGSGQFEEASAALLAAEGCGKPVIVHIGAFRAASETLTAAVNAHDLAADVRESKVDALRRAGAIIVESPAQVGLTMKSALDERKFARRERLADSDFVTVMRRVEQEVYCAP
ncbi:MAG: hypothetical protein ACTSW2_09885 [Alphaproteobacteria bacterium]